MIIIKYRRLTADKREIEDIPKLPLATSFIRKTLGESTKEGVLDESY